MQNLAAKIRTLKGWRRYLLAFLAGALSTVALSPVGFVVILFVTFPLLVWLLQGTLTQKKHGTRAAFGLGWHFAFGYFVFGLYWISFAMLVDAASFAWLIPFASLVLPAVCALYYGLAAALWRRVGWKGAPGVILFALLFFAAEAARGTLFSGFPWNLFGYGWGGVWPVMQITSVIGIYGLTLFTLLFCALPALLWEPGTTLRGKLTVTLCILVPLLGAGFWGQARLAAPLETLPGPRIRLVQPNLGQVLRITPEERAENLQKILELTTLPAPQPYTHIIWPETATQYPLHDNASLRATIMHALPPDTYLLTGTVRSDWGEGLTRYFNSFITIDHAGTVVAVYDKSHLVPFGEYVPLRNFPAIAAAAGGMGDFTPGPGKLTLGTPGLPGYSPLVCYEAVFSGTVTEPGTRPGFLLNITNDAWYGRSAGPYQHLAIARVRAVEEGLPLLRAANTGITAVTDAYGRITERMELGRAGVIDTALPAALPPTLFARYGNTVPAALFFAILAIGIMMRLRSRSQGKS